MKCLKILWIGFLLVIYSIGLRAQHDIVVNNKIDSALFMKYLLDIEMRQEASIQDLTHAYDELLSWCEQYHYKLGMAYTVLYKGNACLNRGDFQQSIKSYLLAEKYVASIVDGKQLLPNIYSNLGSAYQQQKDYSNAYLYFEKAQEAAKEVGEQFLNKAYYLNFGIFLAQVDHPLPQVVGYVNTTLKSAILSNDSVVIVKCYLNLSHIFHRYQKYDSALIYGQKALKSAQRMQWNEFCQIAMLNIGAVYQDQQQYDSAFQYYSEVKRIITPGTSLYLLSKVYLGLADVYAAQQKYQNAFLYYQLSDSICNRYGFKDVAYFNQLGLAKIYTHKNQFEQGYEALKNYIVIKDSLEQLDLKTKINYLETRYQVAQQNELLYRNELLITEQQKSLREKNFIITIIVLVIIGGALFTILYFLQWKKIVKQRKITAKHQEEVHVLKAKINGEEDERNRVAKELHDGIGGIVASLQLQMSQLQPFATSGQYEKFKEHFSNVLYNLQSEVRITAYNLTPTVLLNHGPFYAIDLFCHTLNQSDELEIVFQKIGNDQLLQKEFSLALYRIVQEILQNAVKHAQANQILVQLECNDDLVMITVEDDGKGFDYHNVTKGLGWKNIESRVKAFEGIFTINSNVGQGTTVVIEFHYPQYFKNEQ